MWHPLLIIGSLIGVGMFSSSSGSSFGQTAGQGASDAIVIVGIAAGVGILIYAVHKSGGKR